jgi:hypothetical protein
MLAGMLVAACGGSADHPVAPPSTQRAGPLRTSTSGGISYDIRQETGPGGRDVQRVVATGVFDDTGLNATAKATDPDGNTALLQERVSGNDLYLAFPPGVFEQYTHGKAWVWWDLNESAQALLPQEFVKGLGMDQPLGRPLDRMTTPHGVPTTHYRNYIQTRELAVATAGFSALAAGGGDRCSGNALESTPAPVDIWVDDAGELRMLRVDATYRFTAASKLPTVHEVETLELWDLPPAEPITPPPPGQVDRSGDLLQKITEGRRASAAPCPG